MLNHENAKNGLSYKVNIFFVEFLCIPFDSAKEKPIGYWKWYAKIYGIRFAQNEIHYFNNRLCGGISKISSHLMIKIVVIKLHWRQKHRQQHQAQHKTWMNDIWKKSVHIDTLTPIAYIYIYILYLSEIAINFYALYLYILRLLSSSPSGNEFSYVIFSSLSFDKKNTLFWQLLFMCMWWRRRQTYWFDFNSFDVATKNEKKQIKVNWKLQYTGTKNEKKLRAIQTTVTDKLNRILRVCTCRPVFHQSRITIRHLKWTSVNWKKKLKKKTKV